jgi:predicted AAA+ superfamily ATPase
MLFQRDLKDPIFQWLDKKEVLIIYGARQVGKSTLLRQLFSKRKEAIIFNCELPVISETLASKDLQRIKSLFENYKIIALDEAQTIPEIGSILKLIYDELPQYKIIATGSSSFDLSNKLSEPLTGRNIKFKLFPLSLTELKKANGWLSILENLKQLLVYGSYPGIMNLETATRQMKLAEITSDYLFRDILIYENVKSPNVIRQLLKALALQTGQLVSTNELSNMLGISRSTVEKYIDLLEKSFVIFHLSPYSNNLRNEIRKSNKYYFYDLGIRNALIGNFTPFDNRNDQGNLWENFCVVERMKWLNIHQPLTNCYFWRTYDGAEIDLVEETDNSVRAFEFKWKKKRKPKLPESFAKTYNVSSYQMITSSDLHLIIE